MSFDIDRLLPHSWIYQDEEERATRMSYVMLLSGMSLRLRKTCMDLREVLQACLLPIESVIVGDVVQVVNSLIVLEKHLSTIKTTKGNATLRAHWAAYIQLLTEVRDHMYKHAGVADGVH